MTMVRSDSPGSATLAARIWHADATYRASLNAPYSGRVQRGDAAMACLCVDAASGGRRPKAPEGGRWPAVPGPLFVGIVI